MSEERLNRVEQKTDELQVRFVEFTNLVSSVVTSVKELASDQRETRHALSDLVNTLSVHRSEISERLGQTGKVSIVWVMGGLVSVLSLIAVLVGLMLTFMTYSTDPILRDTDRNSESIRVLQSDYASRDDVHRAEQSATRQIQEVRDELLRYIDR